MKTNREPDATLVIGTATYRMAAIKKTAYKFGGRCHVAIRELDDSAVEVCLTMKDRTVAIDHLVGEFQNELLDQELREQIAIETSGIRDLLLAEAFSDTSLIDPTSETADFRLDPRGISLADRLTQRVNNDGP